MKTLEKRQRLARYELSVCYVFRGARACLNTNYPLLGRKFVEKLNCNRRGKRLIVLAGMSKAC